MTTQPDQTRETILSNEESLDDIGGFIVKRGNQALEGYDAFEQPLEEANEEPQAEPSENEVDLSVFDQLDGTPEAEEEPTEEDKTKEQQTLS